MINQLEPKHLGISNSLLEFLAPEEDRKLTKLEAYRDLLEMATHFKGHVSCYGQEFDLVPGEIITSISELAKNGDGNGRPSASLWTRLWNWGRSFTHRR